MALALLTGLCLVGDGSSEDGAQGLNGDVDVVDLFQDIGRYPARHADLVVQVLHLPHTLLRCRPVVSWYDVGNADLGWHRPVRGSGAVGRSGDRGQMAVSCRLIGWLWSPVATPATRIGCLFPASLSCVLNPTLDAVDRRCHRHGRCGCPMRLMVFRRHHPLRPRREPPTSSGRGVGRTLVDHRPLL